MARKINTEIIINTSAEKVWQVLTNFDAFPEWNPFIQSISGQQKVGKKLTVSIAPPDSNAMTFTPKVLVAEANKELRWLGGAPIKGIFDGEHYFIIENQGNDSVKFIHGENFGGIMIPFMNKMLDKTEVGFRLMNEAIKKRCEE